MQYRRTCFMHVKSCGRHVQSVHLFQILGGTYEEKRKHDLCRIFLCSVSDPKCRYAASADPGQCHGEPQTCPLAAASHGRRMEYRFPLRGRRIFPGSLWIPSAACHGKCTDKWKNIWCIHSRRRDPGQERLAVL